MIYKRCVCVGLVAEQFLESTATQLSYHGLCELNTTAKEGEMSVFFRNNHFSTMIKHKVETNARSGGGAQAERLLTRFLLLLLRGICTFW